MNKKLNIAVIILSAVLILTACGNGAEKNNSQSSESTSAPYDEIVVAEIIPDYHPLEWCGNSYEYETQDEAVSKRFSSMLADGDTERINALQTLDSGERGMYAFSIKNLPEGFEVGRVYETSGITYSKVMPDDPDEFAKTEKIDFCARIDSDDSRVTEYNDIWSSEGKDVNKISNKTDVYYVDYDADNYQVYWAEDGYFFTINFPKSVGTIDPETHEYSGADIFEIKKTFYVFDETNVIE
ncbi:MAG: hypothetical protein IJO29_09555 [Oscillospiraceae bacterium]|nr:hypothetical protein [Oscillospiraceae bacterium]